MRVFSSHAEAQCRSRGGRYTGHSLVNPAIGGCPRLLPDLAVELRDPALGGTQFISSRNLICSEVTVAGTEADF